LKRIRRAAKKIRGRKREERSRRRGWREEMYRKKGKICKGRIFPKGTLSAPPLNGNLSLSSATVMISPTLESARPWPERSLSAAWSTASQSQQRARR